MARKHHNPKVGEVIVAPGVGKVRLRSAEAVEVARWFGLGVGPRRRPSTSSGQSKRRVVRGREPQVELAPGTLTSIYGPSGSGKSVLLRRLRERHKARERRWIDLDAIALPDVPVVNCFGEQPIDQTLKLLNRVGLGEAWTYLRTPEELSEGQRFRLRLAIALDVVERMGIRDAAALCPGVGEGKGVVIACDEFAAVLDRLTALIVANCLRGVVNGMPGLAVVVATSHEDLGGALKPDEVVRCDFGKVSVERSS